MNLPPRHRDTGELNRLTSRIIQCAINVHIVLGPGHVASAYETAMCIERDDAGLRYERQRAITAYYKGHLLGEYCVDLLVEDLLNFLRQADKPVGLLINFNSRLLKDGITRRIL